MTLSVSGPVSADLIAQHNAAASPALAEDYAALGRKLERRGVDIEAVFWLASDASNKSTGNMINVDAGNVQAFTR